CRGAPDRAGLGSAAEGCALSRAAAALGLRPWVEDHACGRRCPVSDPALDLLRRRDGRAETGLVGDGGGHAAARGPAQGGAPRRGAIDPDRLPHRPRDFLYRGVSGRDDYLDRRAWACPRHRFAQLSGGRYVRAADHHLVARIAPQWLAADGAILFAARVY